MGKMKHYTVLLFRTVRFVLFEIHSFSLSVQYTVRGATEAEPKFVFMFYDASQLLQTYLYIVYCAHILYISDRSRGEPYTVYRMHVNINRDIIPQSVSVPIEKGPLGTL
jgi:hypothetical protein